MLGLVLEHVETYRLSENTLVAQVRVRDLLDLHVCRIRVDNAVLAAESLAIPP